MSGLFIISLFVQEVLGSMSDSAWCIEFPHLMDSVGFVDLRPWQKKCAIDLAVFVSTNLDACNLDP